MDNWEIAVFELLVLVAVIAGIMSIGWFLSEERHWFHRHRHTHTL